jgi:hypothetical protein
MSLLHTDEDWHANSLITDIPRSPLSDRFIQKSVVDNAINIDNCISSSLFEGFGGAERGVGSEINSERNEVRREGGRKIHPSRARESAMNTGEKETVNTDEIKGRLNMFKDVGGKKRGEDNNDFYRNLKDLKSIEDVNNKCNIIAALKNSVEINKKIGSIKKLNLATSERNISNTHKKVNQNMYNNGYIKGSNMNDIIKNNDRKKYDELNNFDSSPLFFRKLQQQSELSNSFVKPHQLSTPSSFHKPHQLSTPSSSSKPHQLSTPSSSHKPHQSTLLSSHPSSSYPLPSNTYSTSISNRKSTSYRTTNDSNNKNINRNINYNNNNNDNLKNNDNDDNNDNNDDYFTHRSSSSSPHTKVDSLENHRNTYDNSNPNLNDEINPNPISSDTRQDYFDSHRHSHYNPNPNPNPNFSNSRNPNPHLNPSHHYNPDPRNFANSNDNTNNKNTFSNSINYDNNKYNNSSRSSSSGSSNNIDLYENNAGRHRSSNRNNTSIHQIISNSNIDNNRYYLATPNKNNIFNDRNDNVTPSDHYNNNKNENFDDNNETPKGNNIGLISSSRSFINAFSPPDIMNSIPPTSNSAYFHTPNNTYPNPRPADGVPREPYPPPHNTYTPITPINTYSNIASKSPLYRVIINSSGSPLLVPCIDDSEKTEGVVGEIGMGGNLAVEGAIEGHILRGKLLNKNFELLCSLLMP